jgi:sRNA-binding carbon storage regulator CsrA
MEQEQAITGFIENEAMEKHMREQEKGRQEIDLLFHAMNNVKLDSIKEAMDEIKEMIIEREKLRIELSFDLEKVALKFTNFLTEKKETLSPEQVIEIQRKVIEIDEDRAREKLTAWKDIAMLRKELREYKLALKEKKDGMDMLESTMNM